jgi:hypothetical protein
VRSPESGDQHLDAAANDVLHLALVPVARVGDDHPGRLCTGPRQLALGGVHHRLEVAEVGRLDRHLGGDQDRRSVTAACAL